MGFINGSKFYFGEVVEYIVTYCIAFLNKIAKIFIFCSNTFIRMFRTKHVLALHELN